MPESIFNAQNPKVSVAQLHVGRHCAPLALFLLLLLVAGEFFAAPLSHSERQRQNHIMVTI